MSRRGFVGGRESLRRVDIDIPEAQAGPSGSVSLLLPEDPDAELSPAPCWLDAATLPTVMIMD